MFIFDLNKSRTNERKHGISFGEAKELWKDKYRVEKQVKNITESRFAVTGIIDGILWTAIITYRDEFIRLISVRRARKNEKEDYYSRRV
ncbi:MAG: toxin [Bacteroidetes bacterium CG12_big_fil_rev_8_21_14_0_65_60_17]|nr:MAG: toxin [Bacteroidetes bacterium CG12_big_fil_rev_8_21_14_0_65_60_17]